MERDDPFCDLAPHDESSRRPSTSHLGRTTLKMKTHKAAIQSLFESNDQLLDAEEIYAIAKAIG